MSKALHLVGSKMQNNMILALRSMISMARMIKNSRPVEIRKVPPGKRLLVCGNGPSLREQLETQLPIFQENDVICVNAMSDTDWFSLVRPKYYCLMDSAAVELPELLTPYSKQVVDGIWAGLEKADWEIELILPRQFQKSAYLRERLKKVACSVQYINTTHFDGYSCLRDFFLRKQLCAPAVQTVLVAALYYGICKGYDRIYLLGSEMNFIKGIEVDENNGLSVNYTHFYKGKKQRRLTDAYGNTIPIAEVLEADARVFRQYMFLEAYAKKMGVKIYNATPRSWVDAFERVELSRIHGAS